MISRETSTPRQGWKEMHRAPFRPSSAFRKPPPLGTASGRGRDSTKPPKGEEGGAPANFADFLRHFAEKAKNRHFSTQGKQDTTRGAKRGISRNLTPSRPQNGTTYDLGNDFFKVFPVFVWKFNLLCLTLRSLKLRAYANGRRTASNVFFPLHGGGSGNALTALEGRGHLTEGIFYFPNFET